jgi:lysophospholipase L1-like esterase
MGSAERSVMMAPSGGGGHSLSTPSTTSGVDARVAAAAAAAAAPSSIHVALIGDSTIDNVVWVEAASESVTEMLKRELLAVGHGGDDAAATATVTNLAADGFTSADCLHGAPAFISASRRAEAGDPFPVARIDESFAPLRHLASLSPPPTHVVLSVGGNDIREILGEMSELPARIAAFHTNYPEIVRGILEACPNAKVVIMLQVGDAFHQHQRVELADALQQRVELADALCV